MNCCAIKEGGRKGTSVRRRDVRSFSFFPSSPIATKKEGKKKGGERGGLHCNTPLP